MLWRELEPDYTAVRRERGKDEEESVDSMRYWQVYDRTADTRMLLNLILDAGGEEPDGYYLTDNPEMECAFYPESHTLVVINNADTVQECAVRTQSGVEKVRLEAYDTLIREL